eukprot:gene8226-8417_t
MFTCHDLLKLGNTKNIRAVNADAMMRPAIGAEELCTLERLNRQGSFQLSASSNNSISTVVLRYLEQGAGSVMTLISRGQRTRLANVASPMASAITAAGVWIPKATAVSLPLLPANVTLSLAAFPKGSAIQLVSVEVTMAPAISGSRQEAFQCYNHCPDIMPYGCGIGVCTKNAAACSAFIRGAVSGVFSLVGSILGALAPGAGVVGVAQALKSAAEVAQFFSDTKMCVLKKDIASNGPHGSDKYHQGLRVAVAVTRLRREQIDWQWARGSGSTEGALVQVPNGGNQHVTSMRHAENGAPNTVLCQLVCITASGCTHIVYNNEHCWFMDAFGSSKTTIAAATSTAVNVQRWPSYDI